MLTDAFFRRYEDVQLFSAFGEPYRRFCGQVVQLITDEVHKRNEKSFKERDKDPAISGLTLAHDRIARELGVSALSPAYYEHFVGLGEYRRKQWSRYLIETLIRNYFGTAPTENTDIDLYMKHRLSFVEQAFQIRSEQILARRVALITMLNNQSGKITGEELFNTMPLKHVWASTRNGIVADQQILESQVAELNERFRQARMPLTFHSNLIQMSDDALLEEELERPFWNIVADPKWANVDLQMKEAIDHRDRGERNAVSSAMNALESTIKTISDVGGWTKGTEKGAAHYIDNLVKERNGVRFLAVWEKDVLVKLFGDIRNAFGHGPSSGQPLPTLLPEQTAWAIDTCMAWIKSLVRRA
jgi:hypothetical protein